MADSELARRMFAATNRLEQAFGRPVTFEEIGARVAQNEDGREKPYAASVVARWIKSTQEPRYRSQQRAIARALGVDPGWLWFGDESAAPMLRAPDNGLATRAAEPEPEEVFLDDDAKREKEAS